MAAATPVNRQWRLQSRPTGLIKADKFDLATLLQYSDTDNTELEICPRSTATAV
jgi:hypothetical protein